jgi:hypothetical protein
VPKPLPSFLARLFNTYRFNLTLIMESIEVTAAYTGDALGRFTIGKLRDIISI